MVGPSRTRTRVNYSAHVLVKSSSKETVRGQVRDIAIDGLYLQIEPIFEIDEKVKVEIILLGADSELVIKVVAIVVRKDATGMALRFTTPLEWWPVFTFFPLHKLDSEKIISDD